MRTVKNLLVVVMTFLSVFTYAQSKVGHINTNELLKQMPEVIAAQKRVDTLNQKMQDRIDNLVAEYTQLRQAFVNLPEDTPKSVIEDEQKRLVQMEERIQNFQENAEQESMELQKKLLEPILDKVQKVIDEVAEEKGYDYILDTSAGIVLYANDADDITSFVKAKLGVTE